MATALPPIPLLETRSGGRRSGDTVALPTGLARTLILAAAITGLAEITLQRLAAPLSGSALLVQLGSMSQRATAWLAVLAAALWAASLWRTYRVAAFMLAIATAAVVLAGPLSATAIQLAGVAGVVALLAVVFGLSPRSWVHAALLAAGTAIIAGIWPLVALSADIGWVGVTTARTIAEASLSLVPIALAIDLVLHRRHHRIVWQPALLCGLGAGIAVATAGQQVAMSSHLALGVSLSLAPALYVVSAACAGLLAAEWLVAEPTRPLAAALALLALTGTAPSAAHHTLAALMGFLLLAALLPITRRPPAGGTLEE